MKPFELVDSGSLVTRRQLLSSLASQPGARRLEFLEAVAKLKKTAKAIRDTPVTEENETERRKALLAAAAISIQYGSKTAVVDATGELMLYADKFAYVNSVHPSLASSVSGAAFANKQIGNTVVPCGLCVILGKGGTGKTPLAQALAMAGSSSYAHVRVGEPLSGYLTDESQAALALASAMLASDNVVLDSIKDLLATPGAAMKAGISRAAIAALSGWSTVANEAGCTLYVPLNASTDDAEVYNMLREMAQSNATGTVMFGHTLERTSSAEQNYASSEWTYHFRQGEGLPRVSGRLTLRFNKGMPVVDIDGSSRTLTSEEEVERTAKYDIPGWDDITRRALIPSDTSDE